MSLCLIFFTERLPLISRKTVSSLNLSRISTLSSTFKGKPGGGFSFPLLIQVQEETCLRPIMLSCWPAAFFLRVSAHHLASPRRENKISEPLGKSDHEVLKFDYLLYWTSKIAWTKRLQNVSTADFRGPSFYLSKWSPDWYRKWTFNTQLMCYSWSRSEICISQTCVSKVCLPLWHRINRVLDCCEHLFFQLRFTPNLKTSLLIGIFETWTEAKSELIWKIFRLVYWSWHDKNRYCSSTCGVARKARHHSYWQGWRNPNNRSCQSQR